MLDYGAIRTIPILVTTTNTVVTAVYRLIRFVIIIVTFFQSPTNPSLHYIHQQVYKKCFMNTICGRTSYRVLIWDLKPRARLYEYILGVSRTSDKFTH